VNLYTKVWPICPRPQPDESLLSWFERVAHEYAMSPALLLSAVRQSDTSHQVLGHESLVNHLYERSVADRLAVLAQLTASERKGLWPALTEWDLKTQAYCAFCPYCCMDDLRCNRTPYGRHFWQQSWYTVCRAHGIALVVRNLARVPANRSYWSDPQLRSVADYSHADQYRSYNVVSEPAVRSNILACLVEIERSAAEALSGITPNLYLWGKLTAGEFLVVLGDLTTWSLTHFEPVRCWSAAEELTATEVQEGHGLVGRTGRMSGSDYGERRWTRSLSDVANPKVRGAALWTAHALMATCHTAASDRPSGTTTQDRQHACLSRAAPASRRWLAQCQTRWPKEYCRDRWIKVEAMHQNRG
jgi:hypothetical protein